MTKSVLICTVGGSHQPILKAIASTRPEFVCFICTGKDPETGKAGSETQVNGKGLVISETKDGPMSLPNIPSLAELREGDFEVCIVPADDLDAAFSEIRTTLARLKVRFPDARLIADYTGGTKSMTAALVIAALETDDTNLQLVTGARTDLVEIANHTEYTVAANVDRIRLERAMQPYLKAWNRYAYDEAAAGLADIPAPSDTRLRTSLSQAHNLSQAFAAWDRFDHHTALTFLDIYRPRIGATLGLHLKALEMITEESGSRREPLQIYELWLNAQRRAAQGRYDDAVARVYRLLEWSAQWQLRIHAELDTADIPEGRIPAGVVFTKNRQGKYQAGLFQAWSLLSRIPDNPAALFFHNNGNEMLDHLLIRNQSILAHGYAAIGKTQWEPMRDWLQQSYLPMLKELIRTDGGIRFDLDRLQLPTQVPELVSD